MTDVPHQLEALLHSLATDSSSFVHLSYILDHLSPSALAPSPHLQKWLNRVTSLMHSKDAAARWAAICIAHRMSFLSGTLLTDNAHSWVAIVFPSLLKPEPVPILKASMRYLCLVLCAAVHTPEFQKQVAIPLVPKVSSALLTIADKHSNLDVKTSSIQVLTLLVPLYPSLHKALSQRLYALCNQIFSCSVLHTTDGLLDAAVKLHAVLHFLGGKVGGPNLWRNCLDEVLQLSWSAWLTLRTTFPSSEQLSRKVIAYLRSADGKLPCALSNADMMTSPLTAAALSLDRLKRGVSAISALLRAPVNRPVKVPIGHIIAFCCCLLASSSEDEGQTHIDLHVRAAESAVVPQIWIQACRLLSCLAQTMQDLLVPHTPRLIMIISSHLEKNHNMEQSLGHSFLCCVHQLLFFCPVVGATLGINRLLKATISILSPLYLHQPRTETNVGGSGQSRANKRRREYEVDNVLSVNNFTACATTNECDTMVTALEVVDQCLLNAELAPSTRSLANRVLLSILLSLPLIPSSSLSPDPSFRGRVAQKVREICVENVQGVSYAMSKGTNLVLCSLSSENLVTCNKLYSRIDLLLHPRRPPLVRTLPFVESLSLLSAEESADETAIRRSLGLAFSDGNICLIPSMPENHPRPINQNSVPLCQQILLGSQEDGACTEPHPNTTNDDASDDFHAHVQVEAMVPPILPAVLPLQTVSDAPVPLSVPPKDTVSAVYVAPMLIDESDHEVVPMIDLGSDSEAELS